MTVPRKDDPFSGTWIFHANRSTLPMPAPQRWIQRVEASGGGVSITEEIVLAAGNSLTVLVRARFDGAYYPVTGSPLADAISYHRVDTHTIAGTGVKHAKNALVETIIVSPDRKTLTLNFSLVSESVVLATGVAIFEKAEEVVTRP